MRKVVITDKKILEVLNKKGALTIEQNKILEKMNALEKQFNTCIAKTKMLDEKSRPMIRKLIPKLELGEYEEISAVRQEKGWHIEIADRMEEFKVSFERMKKSEKSLKEEIKTMS